MPNNKTKNFDIAGKNHWDSIYNTIEHHKTYSDWTPSEYHYKVISIFIDKAIRESNSSNILEVGCGNSKWLSYLAKRYSLDPVGIDYSAKGCELAKNNLHDEQVKGKIICCDMFNPSNALSNRFDIVYSIGVVEHFDNLLYVLLTLKTFVRTNGTLITIIPNLHSIHGVLCHLWHPELLRKHVILKRKELVKIYTDAGFTNIKSAYGGFFSLSIVQWNNCSRWPKFGKALYPYIARINRHIHTFLDKKQIYQGNSLLSPYIIIYGIK